MINGDDGTYSYSKTVHNKDGALTAVLQPGQGAVFIPESLLFDAKTAFIC